MSDRTEMLWQISQLAEEISNARRLAVSIHVDSSRDDQIRDRLKLTLEILNVMAGRIQSSVESMPDND